MKLTYEIFTAGKSSRGGYTDQQLDLFISKMERSDKGWKWKIIGKQYPSETIKEFLDLKDKHVYDPSDNFRSIF